MHKPNLRRGFPVVLNRFQFPSFHHEVVGRFHECCPKPSPGTRRMTLPHFPPGIPTQRSIQCSVIRQLTAAVSVRDIKYKM